jgi:hypothetical protein
MKSLQMDDDGSSDSNSSRCLWQGELKSDLIRGDNINTLYDNLIKIYVVL